MTGRLARRLVRALGLTGLGTPLVATTSGVAFAAAASPAKELSQFETYLDPEVEHVMVTGVAGW